MLIHNLLENAAARHPDKIAVIHDDERTSYRQLNSRVQCLARHLNEHGIAKGDRIALLLENSIDYIIAYYAVLKVGAVASPINPGLKPDGLQYLLNDLEPAGIIANFKSERLLKAVNLEVLPLKALILGAPKQRWSNTPFNVSTFEEIPVSIHNEIVCAAGETDLASIIYTSGSTGKPKGVMLSHKNVVSNTLSICEYLHIGDTDIQMVVLPFFYVMGKSLLNTHIAAAGTVVINNRFLYPADVVHQMIKEQVTSFSGVPSTYAYLLKRSPLVEKRDQLQSLRYVSQAGGHMAGALKRALRKSLPDHTQIYIMYGATEASARLAYLEPAYFETKIESIGTPIPGVTLRIMDEEKSSVPDGCQGELVASGPNIMQGYWKDPRYTASVLDDHGYHTGDIGYRDAEGFFYIVRRKDGMLKVGGHRINPVEVEDFLMATDLVVETAVVGIPDPLLGNKMVALVVAQDDIDAPRTLMQRCAEGLPGHKRPSIFVPVRALPKNANGKIDLNACITLASQHLMKSQ